MEQHDVEWWSDYLQGIRLCETGGDIEFCTSEAMREGYITRKYGKKENQWGVYPPDSDDLKE